MHSGWSSPGAPYFAPSTTAHSGSGSLSVNVQSFVGSNNLAAAQSISVVAGQTYTISAWVATNSAAAGRVPVTLLGN